MIDKLKKLILPVDDLTQEYRLSGRHPRQLTLDFVREYQGRAKSYILRLLEETEKYGYLYYLWSQNLYRPLHVEFQGQTFMACGQEKEIQQELERQASQFFRCDSIQCRITYAELVSFYIRLLNPSLSWIAVEYMIQSVPYHAHLILSPERRYSYREIKA